MSVHTLHPSIRTHGLADDCPRCAEHAHDPLGGLDDDNLRALIVRTIDWMHDEEFPRSDVEALAMRNIEGHIRFAWAMERLVGEAVQA